MDLDRGVAFPRKSFTFAKSQLELLLSLDHRRLDDCQSLGARTVVAQKKAECRGIGRDVSLFHLVTWVLPCLVGLFGLLVVLVLLFFLIVPRFFAWLLPRAN